MKINNIEESVPFKKKISSEVVARRSAEACKFIKKETLVQVFSGEFCEISPFVTEHLQWLLLFLIKIFLQKSSLQTHHVDSTLNRRVESTWCVCKVISTKDRKKYYKSK